MTPSLSLSLSLSLYLSLSSFVCAGVCVMFYFVFNNILIISCRHLHFEFKHTHYRSGFKYAKTDAPHRRYKTHVHKQITLF